MRMIQRRNRPRFPLEAIAEPRFRQLDGDNPVEARLASLVNLAHAARTGSSEYFVGTQPFSNRKGHGFRNYIRNSRPESRPYCFRAACQFSVTVMPRASLPVG